MFSYEKKFRNFKKSSKANYILATFWSNSLLLIFLLFLCEHFRASSMTGSDSEAIVSLNVVFTFRRMSCIEGLSSYDWKKRYVSDRWASRKRKFWEWINKGFIYFSVVSFRCSRPMKFASFDNWKWIEGTNCLSLNVVNESDLLNWKLFQLIAPLLLWTNFRTQSLKVLIDYYSLRKMLVSQY